MNWVWKLSGVVLFCAGLLWVPHLVRADVGTATVVTGEEDCGTCFEGPPRCIPGEHKVLKLPPHSADLKNTHETCADTVGEEECSNHDSCYSEDADPESLAQAVENGDANQVRILLAPFGDRAYLNHERSMIQPPPTSPS